MKMICFRFHITGNFQNLNTDVCFSTHHSNSKYFDSFLIIFILSTKAADKENFPSINCIRFYTTKNDNFYKSVQIHLF